MELKNIKLWIVLSTKWEIVDVQAALVVFISILSFVAVFTSARYFWHMSARRISKNADVPISSLLSFTTLGEVMDVMILLKSKIIHSKHLSLALQCFFVIVFSACAIFAGPISRYATRVGQVDAVRPVHGKLATRSYQCSNNDNINWNNVSQSLKEANFPLNQLLDFLPDTKSNWAYHAEDWNSTYTLKCSSTIDANITLEALGNYTSNEFYVYDNIPKLADVYSARFLEDENNTSYFWYYTGTQMPAAMKYRDLLFYSYAEHRPDGDGNKLWDATPTKHLSVHLSIIGMLDVPMRSTVENGIDTYYIGKGKIPSAWYSRIECDVVRKPGLDSYNYWEAMIDTDGCGMGANMDSYFSAQSTVPHGDNSSTINLPTGDELIRFYQAYQITKDTHFPHPVTRNINLRVPTIEVSTLFIAVMGFITLLVIIGLIFCLVCRFTYSDLYKRVPETKVDWLLQSLREANSNGLAGHGPATQVSSQAPSVFSDDEEKHTGAYREKMPWEKAVYSLSNPHYSSTPSSNGYSSPGSINPGMGKVTINRGANTPSPAPSSLTPGRPSTLSPPPVSFPAFINNNTNNGYSPIQNSAPYPAPYTGASPAPTYTSPPMSPSATSDRIVSYGLGTAKAQPVVTVGSRSERNEWEVGIVENRR